MVKIGSVLLVDDDRITNYINERLLVKNSFAGKITIKHNGQEAINYLEEECDSPELCPELILLDINMPILNGLEFIELLQTTDAPALKNSKICFVSTSENEMDQQKIRKLGDFYFVSKPLTSAKLMDIFKNLLKLS